MNFPAANLRAMLLVPAIIAAASAQAQDTRTPLTREAVRAEYVRAQRAGELLTAGESAITLKASEPTAMAGSTIEVRGRLPRNAERGTFMAAGERGQFVDDSAPWGVVKERRQVVGEFFEALRTGDVMVAGEMGMTRREMAPMAYPVQSLRVASIR